LGMLMGEEYGRPLDPLDGVGRRAEGRLKSNMLFGDVEAIEAIEIHEPIAAPDQQWLPVPVRWPEAIGFGCFDHDDPGAHALERKSLNRLLFPALAIDLQ